MTFYIVTDSSVIILGRMKRNEPSRKKIVPMESKLIVLTSS